MKKCLLPVHLQRCGGSIAAVTGNKPLFLIYIDSKALVKIYAFHFMVEKEQSICICDSSGWLMKWSDKHKLIHNHTRM